MGVDTDLLLRHYAIAGPLLERYFAGIPFVWSTLPGGVGGPTIYHGPLSDRTVPKGPVVNVPSATGMHRYPALSAERIEGLVRHGAIEFYSWTPATTDPTRARFGRILIETLPDAEYGTVFEGINAVEDVLRSARVRWVRIFDGRQDAALWIPFSDAPSYDDARAWLHERCLEAVQRCPTAVTLAPNSHGGDPALSHLHVQSNAVGRFSILPYSVRAQKGYPIAIPAGPHFYLPDDAPRPDTRVAGQLHAWVTMYGDGFEDLTKRFWAQRFATVAKAPAMPAQRSHGPIVNAAIAVLQDGRSHSAEEIMQIAEQRGLLDERATQKYVYTSLIEYIARANGNGRKPAVVQNADRTFRINEPPDEWPPLAEEEPASDPTIEALIERLRATASGGKPAEFEQAVCDAFDALGFAATHDGGQKAPDGFADAPLGVLSYRVMIECKSADEGVNDPGVFEAAKFKEGYGAQYCALVGRAFSGEIELVKELHNHGVSAWTVDDLAAVLRNGVDPFEMRPAFEPGFAADAIDDVLWERQHGRAKRVRLVAEAIVRTGTTTQAGYRGAPAEAPRITEDVAMVLVDQDLAAQGSSATCSREDVRDALDFLANPLVGAVVRDGSEGGVVVVRRPSTGSG